AAAVTVSVAIEPARQDEVIDLLRQSDDYTFSLYPPESAYLLDVADLESDAVSVFVARPTADAAAGAGAGTRAGAVGMIALVSRGDGSAELKRMFVSPAARGLGVAMALLAAVEQHAVETGHTLLQLETGPLQPHAINLYKKAGFHPIPNFGQYIGDELSYCMEKSLGSF
ncbi:MAG: putative acetyl transferase, partial [Glaciihabitans sp.]|nr:putative acetyl transferase [Glaciihabitans sp.]